MCHMVKEKCVNNQSPIIRFLGYNQQKKNMNIFNEKKYFTWNGEINATQKIVEYFRSKNQPLEI